MAESSRFWNSNGVGDGGAGGYARALIAAWLSSIFARGGSGILNRIANELAVSGTASPLSVASGAAIVDGLYYENDAALNLTVTTPSNGTTGGRAILRADWAAQTVRAVILLNTDGVAGIPALTQTPGTTYESNLASFTITTGGEIGSLVVEPARISFSDSPRAERINLAAVSVLGRATNSAGAAGEIAAASDGQVMRRNGTSIAFGQLAAAGIADDAVTAEKLAAEAATAQISNGAIGTANLAADVIDDTKLGNRAPQFYRRQGGSASNWNSPGVDTHIPGTVRMLAGVIEIEIPYYTWDGSVTVTLPVSLSNPILLASIVYTTTAANNYYVPFVEVKSGTTFLLTVQIGRELKVNTVHVAWLVIGPES